MVAPASNLIGIRRALVDRAELAAAAVGIATVQYEGEHSEVAGVGVEIMRPRFQLPRRSIVGSEGVPMIRQSGRFVVQIVFPLGTAFNRQREAVEAVASQYREQTLDGGVRIYGDADTTHGVRDSANRTVYEVAMPWETIGREPSAGDDNPETGVGSDADAILAVRRVWEQRIEQPLPDEGWPGLFTFWDGPPAALKTAPATPWCGYWIGAHAAGTTEVDGANQWVRGRVLVQMHTEPRGLVPTLALVERIFAEHNRSTRAVAIGPADAEAQFRTPAGTLQTNFRIPFRFERPR